jgi:hypothetical protein
MVRFSPLSLLISAGVGRYMTMLSVGLGGILHILYVHIFRDDASMMDGITALLSRTMGRLLIGRHSSGADTNGDSIGSDARFARCHLTGAQMPL